MIITGIKNKKWLVYSRANHDFRESPDGEFYVDGGQQGYIRWGGDFGSIVYIDVPYSTADLINDWNTGADKLGIIDLEKETPDYKTLEEFESQEKSLAWGVSTPEGRVYKMLDTLETDHLQNILKTESWHIDEKFIVEVKRILEKRK